VGAVYDADFGPYESSLCRDEGTAADKVTCFSNSGPGVDVLAPGAWIATTAPGARITDFSGTSASCPHAAGAAAVLMAARPDAGVAQVEEALEATGTPITDPRNGVVTPRIDVAAALELLRAAEPQAARAELSRSSLAFGRVRAGRSKTLSFRVANTGNLNLTVVGTTRSPFRVRGLPVVLAPGGVRTVRVTFRPAARRAYTGTLRLITGDPERPQIAVRLRGTGTR
jgi:subtilisin family serine protease